MGYRVVRTAQEIISEMAEETKKVENYGESFDTRPTSDWYRENFALAAQMNQYEERSQETWDNMDLLKAEDPYFFIQAADMFFERKMPAAAKVSITLTGMTLGATAPIGSIILEREETLVQYSNTTEITVISSDPFESSFEATSTGSITNAPVDTITIASSVPLGFEGTFNNATEAQGGQDLETLLEAKKRYFSSSGERYWNISGITNSIRALNGVISVRITPNKTDTTASTGQTTRTIWAVVQGGVDADIIKAIGDSMVDATETYAADYGEGSIVTGDYTYTDGTVVIIRFNRPVEIIVDVNPLVIGGLLETEIEVLAQQYISTVPLGGVISSKDCWNYVVANLPEANQNSEVSFTFREAAEDAWVSYLPLGATEIAKYGELV